MTASTIPTIEPKQVRAGDTWRWSRSFDCYPAPTWVLTYTFYSAAGVLSFDADADGTSHSVNIAAADTAAYTAGRYDWTAAVTDGTDRLTVGSGTIQIFPDVAEAVSYDGRSHARKMLDAIIAILEGRGTDGDLDVVKTNTASHSTEFDLEQLGKWHQQYAAAVHAEELRKALARGENTGRFIGVRFTG